MIEMKSYIYNRERGGQNSKVAKVSLHPVANSAMLDFGTSSVLNVISCYRTPEIMRLSQQFQSKKENSTQLECVTRLSNIPIVETGWVKAGQLYSRIKNSNPLVQWTLGTAESSFNTALEVALPSTVAVLGGPLNILDKFVCKSLDIVEQRVPSIYLPPEMTKQYMSSKFVKPVLKRADSVKQIGNTVLASKYTEFAAERLEDALNVADKYVDKYLPDVADEDVDESENAKAIPSEGGKAVQTIHHVDRFSRKLQRRLTKRTFAEAKALKERSQESINVLLYVAELVVTDPKMAMDKARELWSALSQDEPENQARPATLEQLIVMLTRESARRVVHFVNFTRSTVTKLPHTISWGVNLTSQQCMRLVDGLLKSGYLDAITSTDSTGTKIDARKMSAILQELASFANAVLQRLALVLAGQQEVQKPVKPVQHSQKNRNNYLAPQGQVNLQPPVIRNQLKAARRFANNALNNGAQS